MPRFSLRRLAPVSVLALTLAAPGMASAEVSTRKLCRLAEADSARFMQRTDVAEALIRMADRCPGQVFALTAVTGSIPSVTPVGEAKGNKVGAPVPVVKPAPEPEVASPPKTADFRDLMKRLTRATKDIEHANDRVSDAKVALWNATQRAERAGLTEAELDAAARLDRTLPDFTDEKRRALESYLSARERLSQATKALDLASKKAEPLVEKALELTGLSDVAQASLSSALDGMSPEARKQYLAEALTEAERKASAEAERKAAAEKALAEAEAALKKAVDDREYKQRLQKVQEAQAKLDAARKDHEKWSSQQAMALATHEAAVKADPDCKGSACKQAEKALETANRALEKAAGKVAQEQGHLAKDKERLGLVEAELGIPDLMKAFLGYGAAATEAGAAASEAKALAEEAAKRAQKLSDLLVAATDALKTAEAASVEARAATKTEEDEVAAARRALEAAIEVAKAALGSPEAEAALADVQAKQAALAEALTDLGLAQDAAKEAVAEVVATAGVPPEVADLTEELEEKLAHADQQQADGWWVNKHAENVIAEHEEVTEDLTEALEPAGEAPSVKEAVSTEPEAEVTETEETTAEGGDGMDGGTEGAQNG